MKKTFYISILALSLLKGQFSYPAEDFLGGGIGYSPMYIKLDSVPGATYLKNIGLDPSDFDDPFVVHGGEGFAHVTGRWRIGGYAGMGGTSVSTIPEISIFIDGNGNDSLDAGETSKMYTDELNPSIRARFTFLLGAASVEYVMPILQDLEISSGALLGLGRVAMGIEQTSANPRWKQVFSNTYGTMSDNQDTLFYSVTSDEYDNPDIRPGAVSGVLKDVSSAFF